MKYIDYFFLISGLFFSLYILLFIKIRNKDSSSKNKADSTDLVGIILFSLMTFISANPMPPKIKGYPVRNFQKICFINQRIISETIQLYNEDSKKKTPPDLTTEEINKYIDEVFLKEHYLKSKVHFPSNQCKLEMKNYELYCIRHGNPNKDSQFYKNNKDESYDDDELSNHYKEIKDKYDKDWKETLERAKYLKIVFALTILASIKMLFAFLLS